MAHSVNMVVLVGHVGSDPEARKLAGGKRVATLSLATSQRWSDDTGNLQEKTEWHRVVLWDGLADVVEKYVAKGSQLYVSGHIAYRQWQDRDGQKRYSTEIVAREMVMLGARKSVSGGPGSPKDDDAEEASQGSKARTRKGKGGGKSGQATAAPDNDDVPF